MKAVLLSLGPSLNLYDGDFDGVVIGVKRVATVFACDWWVCLDSPALERDGEIVRGNPKLLTRTDYRPKYSTREGQTVEELAKWHGADVGKYTATAALALTGWLGVETVEVYGADWTNEPDFDGNLEPDVNRSEDRWEKEIRIWNRVKARLAMMGTEVIEVGRHERV